MRNQCDHWAKISQICRGQQGRWESFAPFHAPETAVAGNTRPLIVEGIATANFDFASLNEANQIAEATEMGVVFGNAGDLSASMLVFIDEPGPRPTWPAVSDKRRRPSGGQLCLPRI